MKKRACKPPHYCSTKNPKYKHGHTSDKMGRGVGVVSGTYKSWAYMRTRCSNQRATDYRNYGGRGITCCKRWRLFVNFLNDMGERPHGMSLERIDNSKGYSPNNCKWATKIEQASNQRNNRRITWNGTTMTLAQWARRIGLSPGTLQQRLTRGSLASAMTRPFGRWPSQHKPLATTDAECPIGEVIRITE